MLLGQHLREFLNQLLRFLLALGLDLLQRLDRILRQHFATFLAGLFGRGDFFLKLFVIGGDLLDHFLAFLLRGDDLVTGVNHEHDRQHGEQIDHGNQCIDGFRFIRFGFGGEHDLLFGCRRNP